MRLPLLPTANEELSSWFAWASVKQICYGSTLPVWSNGSISTSDGLTATSPNTTVHTCRETAFQELPRRFDPDGHVCQKRPPTGGQSVTQGNELRLPVERAKNGWFWHGINGPVPRSVSRHDLTVAIRHDYSGVT